MKRNQKFSVQFYPNKQKTKNGELQLYIRVVVDLKRTEIATTHYIPIKVWNQRLRKIRPSFSKAIFLNSFIDNAISEINQIFLKEVSQNKTITSQDIKNIYLGIDDNKTTHKTILEAFNYHNTKMEEQVKIGQVVKKTLERYNITKNKVRAFMKSQYKVKDMPLPDLRLRFVTEFEHYLLTVDKLQSNTAHKYIKNLKKIMNMAVGLDWIPSNPFNQFKCSYTNPEREILNQDEINILLNKKLHTPRLEEVRDVFIFCCYTGFAYSDVYEFRKNAVMKGLDGNLWLSTLRQKTGTKESVPLL